MANAPCSKSSSQKAGARRGGMTASRLPARRLARRSTGPMEFDILTLFPRIFEGPLEESILRRARESGAAQIRVHNLRDFTHDKHRVVDDKPYGGGPGMLMKPEPIFEAVEKLRRAESC